MVDETELTDAKMRGYRMPTIEISETNAERLNKIVPESLRGPRRTTVQNAWLIEQAAAKLIDEGSEKPKGESDE